MIDPQHFTQCLLAWYTTNGRDLPWRKTEDPYVIWISEIMLQQTQVPRVAEHFYPRFLEAFPTLEALSEASWEDVYPVWDGLGYYRRGKNVLKAAKVLMQKHAGILPQTQEALEALPGIGAYTATAIRAFALDHKVPAIDTNISKIVETLWPNKDTKEIAHELVEAASSGRDWNNAMMDLATALRSGETIPGDLGIFFTKELSEKFLPKRKSKPKSKSTKNKKRRKHVIEVGIACIWKDGKYLIQTRPEGKSFTGNWEFPGGKREKGEDIRACVKREIKEEIGIDVSVRPAFFEKLWDFDKIQLLLKFHRCQIQRGEPEALEKQELRWAAPAEFDSIEFLKTNHEALAILKNMKM